jgi:hypothetical protein
MLTLYDRDFYSWIQQQAALLRQGQWSELDVTNLVEEIEAMGRSEKRELKSRLAVLLAHLLKWQYEPNYRSKSWHATIREQRLEITECLEDNPSLTATIPTVIPKAYAVGRMQASRETQMQESAFPSTCPWTLTQILAANFWPEDSVM